MELLNIKVPECFYAKEALRIVQTALSVIHRVDGKQTGGCLFIANQEFGTMASMPLYIGEDLNVGEHLEKAMDSALKLFSVDRYTTVPRGAIKMSNLITSFAGLSNEWNEAVSVAYSSFSYCSFSGFVKKDIHKQMKDFMGVHSPSNRCVSTLADLLYK